MSDLPSEMLDEGEKLLWMRTPSPTGYGREILAVQVVGHVLLTLTAVGLAFCVPGGTWVKVSVGVLFCLSSNAPLFVWAGVKKRTRRGGGALYFVTSRRVGVVEPSGELRQMPITTGLRMNQLPEAIEFGLREQSFLSFAGLRESEQQLVSTLVKNMLDSQKASTP